MCLMDLNSLSYCGDDCVFANDIAAIQRLDRVFTRPGTLVWNPIDPTKVAVVAPAGDDLPEGFVEFDIADAEILGDLVQFTALKAALVSFSRRRWELFLARVEAAKVEAIDSELAAMLSDADASSPAA
jgi:hypothetical protein